MTPTARPARLRHDQSIYQRNPAVLLLLIARNGNRDGALLRETCSSALLRRASVDAELERAVSALPRDPWRVSREAGRSTTKIDSARNLEALSRQTEVNMRTELATAAALAGLVAMTAPAAAQNWGYGGWSEP